jgi:PAT family beta-lactamase induction signal transducer AmpG
MALAEYAAAFRGRKFPLLLLLGFSSGLPLALTAGTMQAWLTVEGVDLKTIGLFALVAQPYTYKFLWAPVMDRYSLPFLGRRRGWLALTQLALLAGIAWMGTLSPRESPWLLATAALGIAFLSASQDVVFDAYRADILSAGERGPGAAVSVLGYRVAMLVSSGLALILVDHWLSWREMYGLMAVLMLVGLIATVWSAEPQLPVSAPRTLSEAFREPLAEYFARAGAWLLLVLIVLYKLGDAFAGSLTTTFLLRGAGFSLSDVGWANKWLSALATILGLGLGGVLMARLRLYRSLLLFGILQAVTNFGYMLLALSGKSYVLLVVAVGLENMAGGMGTAAFVALLISLCDKRFSATQYALLSALAALGRVYVGPAAGLMVEAMGWPAFFLATFVIALPGLAMLHAMRGALDALDSRDDS